MLVTVTINELWLNPISDPESGTWFPLNSLDYSPAVTVTSRPYAGGNFRMVRQRGKQRATKIGLVTCTDVQIKQLEDWQGVALCFRDPRGRRFFGFYTDLAYTPKMIENHWSASFSVTEFTYAEGA